MSPDGGIAQALINSHEHSLLDHHLVDLSTPDPHVLHTWFENHLGYSPPVIDLTLQGFTLIGGRLDTLDNRVVATIVYKCGAHVINLYAWPATQYTGVNALSLRGYYLTHWTRDGMNCWAVADLDASELQQFAHLMNQRIEILF
jgi:anti-sigma factor RsiW